MDINKQNKKETRAPYISLVIAIFCFTLGYASVVVIFN